MPRPDVVRSHHPHNLRGTSLAAWPPADLRLVMQSVLRFSTQRNALALGSIGFPHSVLQREVDILFLSSFSLSSPPKNQSFRKTELQYRISP